MATKKSTRKATSLAAMHKDIESKVNALNEILQSEHEYADLREAEVAVDEACKKYTLALAIGEYDKWLKTDDPILAALTQRDITRVAKQFKQADNKGNPAHYVIKESLVMVNLPAFDEYYKGKKGKSLFKGVDIDGETYTPDSMCESAAFLFSDFLHKKLAVKDALTWESVKVYNRVEFTDVEHAKVLLQNCMNAIHDGFEVEDADYEFARSVITRKVGGYKGKDDNKVKTCKMKAVTGVTIWSIVTDIMAKAVNGYGYDIEEVTVKKESK